MTCAYPNKVHKTKYIVETVIDSVGREAAYHRDNSVFRQ